MQQEKLKNNEIDIVAVIAAYPSAKADYQNAKNKVDQASKQIIEHAKTQPDAFRGEEKSYHLSDGVVVRRATTLKGRFDENKMDSAWLRSILATPSAAAIKVSIDPKKLHHDEETDRLLEQIDYATENQYSFKVEVTTVSVAK